ncbi:MAG TPA: DUF2087 domain-containing protein [Bacillota bacterium]
MESIRCEDFKKRLVELTIKSGLSGFPVKRRDQLILLRAVSNGFQPDIIYEEKTVNEIIRTQVKCLKCLTGLDHVTVRRQLVDERFLSRENDGSRYRLGPGPDSVQFETTVTDLNIEALLASAEAELAARKKAFMERQTTL